MKQTRHQRRWYLKNRVRLMAKSKLRIAQNPEKYRDYRSAYRMKLKIEVLTNYSKRGFPECSCCGVTTLAFLTLEHINNDGAAHRLKYGKNIYPYLRRDNFPKRPRLEVLCHNCNWGKRIHKGVCPHKVVA